MVIRTIGALLSVGLVAYACSGVPRIAPERVGADYRSPFQRSDEASAYSHFLVGRFASLTNDPREASLNYAAVLSDAPGDASVAERAVFNALLADDFETAAQVSESVLSEEVDPPSLARLVSAVDQLRRGRAKDALSALDGSDFGPFNQMVAQNVAAWAVYQREGLAAAQARLASSRTNDTVLDGVTLNMVGFLQLADKQDDAALETFETVWTSGTRLAVATEAHARLLAARGETEEALTLLEKFSKDVGRNPGVSALEETIKSGAPVEIYRPTAKQGAALAVYAPAAALASQTDGDLSGVYFAMALALDPELHVARTLWGEALDDAGRRYDAMRVLSAVPQASAFYATAQGQLAWALRREGLNSDAIRTAEEALAHTSDRDLKIQLGDLFRSLERYGQAVRIFGEVIEADAALSEEDWRLFFARGGVRERLGDWAGAESDLRTALTLKPGEAQVLNYLGYGLVDRGEKLDEALKFIQRAVRRAPKNGQIRDSLGWAYYKLGRYEDAVSELERAVELAPGDPVLNDHLGDAYWQVGRRLEARFQWSRAMGQYIGETEKNLLQAKLDQGLPVASEQAASTTSVQP